MTSWGLQSLQIQTLNINPGKRFRENELNRITRDITSSQFNKYLLIDDGEGPNLCRGKK